MYSEANSIPAFVKLHTEFGFSFEHFTVWSKQEVQRPKRR